MTLHILSLNSPWFEFVKQGVKKYEGRRNTANIQKISVGDTIEIRHYTDATQNPYNVKVEDMLTFATFRDALSVLPIDQVLPTGTCVPYTIDEGDAIYQRYVSLVTQEKDGVVMLKIRPSVE
jgi:ASC-1-like (ASCH) protein